VRYAISIDVGCRETSPLAFDTGTREFTMVVYVEAPNETDAVETLAHKLTQLVAEPIPAKHIFGPDF
jgi:hypothetical protein